MIYLAGPLFTEQQRAFNEHNAQILEHRGHKVWLPQRDNGLAKYEGNNCYNDIKAGDIEGLEQCDTVIATFWDGFIDEGTCYEVGYAEAKNKNVFILCDDHRPMRNEMFSHIPKGDSLEALGF